MVDSLYRLYMNADFHMHRQRFKANPVNERIFKNPNTGIRRVTPKKCTVPEPFDLEIERRMQHRKEYEGKNDEPQFEFHANPVPKAIFQAPVVCIFMLISIIADKFFYIDKIGMSFNNLKKNVALPF